MILSKKKKYVKFKKKRKIKTLQFQTKRKFIKFREKKRKSYGYDFKKSLDTNTIHKKTMNNIIDKNINFIVIKKKMITKQIQKLPYDLRMKIYIFAMKNFNKSYMPVTGRIPIWYNHKNYITKELQKVHFNNIHFLHLDFNTLPENKKWIQGCQCDFCLSQNKSYNYTTHTNFIKDCLGFENDNNYWNDLYDHFPGNIYGMKVFDPQFDKDKFKQPIYFSNEIIEKYL